MTSHQSPKIVLAAVLAACGFAAQAQTAPPTAGQPAMGMHEHGPFDPARMQERMQRRFDSLKRILQITPAQEGVWTVWTTAMKPSPQMLQQHRQQRADLERLTTPERIDRMRQLRAQRNAEMDKRADATKSFYAQLTPPQQKAFDEVSLKFFGGHRGRRHHGM